jgi:acyl dehydratase
VTEPAAVEGTWTVEKALEGLIGQPTAKSTVVVERGPVAFFADAVLDVNPVYRSPQAAAAAGFSAIPAPPTFPLVMETWGKFAELQPQDPPTASAMGAVLGQLMGKGGLILHGEQEFTYHRPVLVGDVLVGEGRIVDAYQKESRGRAMTFIVTETKWAEERTGAPVATSRFNVIHRA